VSAASNNLYAHNDAARTVGAKAKAVLVFPDTRKGAFIVGAQWGYGAYGALRKGTRTIGYYKTAAESYGFQTGVKKFGYALFFMTDSALAYLDASGGWAIGTGPSLVVVDQGAARSLTKRIYGQIFMHRRRVSWEALALRDPRSPELRRANRT
jgi:lipid-binding SYLF domain-containing protein